jgi:dihydropteroate synthase
MPSWRLADRVLDLASPLAVGIVNVTDDSFFEGARSGTPGRAIEDGLALAAEGFDLLDVGAVAARSGPPIAAEDEAGRLVPVVRALAADAGVPVSADTFQAPVAAAALDAGAAVINDVSGGANPELLDLVGGHGCGYVLMHIEGPPRVEREPRGHVDPIAHLLRWFEERIGAAVDRGVAEEQIAIDPGLDFDLSVGDDLEILRRLDELHSLGRPLFVALSRKDFLGAVLTGSWEGRAPARDREWATAAATALAVASGAELVRLHDRSALDALRTAAAIRGRRASDRASRPETEAGGGNGFPVGADG